MRGRRVTLIVAGALVVVVGVLFFVYRSITEPPAGFKPAAVQHRLIRQLPSGWRIRKSVTIKGPGDCFDACDSEFDLILDVPQQTDPALRTALHRWLAPLGWMEQRTVRSQYGDDGIYPLGIYFEKAFSNVDQHHGDYEIIPTEVHSGQLTLDISMQAGD